MKPTYEQLEDTLAKTQEALAKTQNLLRLALERITVLEEKLNKNSKNSSQPPSKDRKPNSDHDSSKKKKPRQGINRTAIPPEKIDKFVNCVLTNCPGCGSRDLNREEKPETLQQVELPEVKATATQFNRFRYKCACCGNRSTASLPTGIPNSAFGTRLMALVAMLTGAFNLAKRDAISLVKNLFDIEICEGSIINIEERVGNALEEVYLRIHKAVTQSLTSKHFDETSWRNRGKNGYVWVASTSQAVCFKINASRSKKAFLQFVGTLAPSPVVTDRYAVYNDVSENHQYCLAHLIRDFKKYGERKGFDGQVGVSIEKELRTACRINMKFRKNEISLKSRNHRLRCSRKRLENHLMSGLAIGSDELAKFCERILDDFNKLWTFAKFSDVDPTNNLAERDLRKIVLWRKKSYGTRSDRGQRFVERISSVYATLKREGRNIFDFLKEAALSFYSNLEAPYISLINGY